MSGERALIRESVDRVLRDAVTPALLAAAEQGSLPVDLWRRCIDNGFDRVLLPADDTTPTCWMNAWPVIRGCGEFSLPLPLPEAIVARWLLDAAGIQQPDGMLTLVIDAQLPGEFTRVPWGRHADWIVAVGEGDRPGLLLIDGRQCEWRHGTNLAGEPRDSTPLPAQPAENPTLPVPADLPRHLGALLRATQIAGAGAALLARSLAHAGDRQQFGRPLAKFQVIQHNLALLAEAVALAEAATAACWQALDRRATGRSWQRDARLLIAAAKTTAGELAGDIAATAHQVHGAMGFSHEHPLHHYSRRLWSWRAECGASSTWAVELGRLALRRGATGLWTDLTAVTDA
jgi:hypothetical protein